VNKLEAAPLRTKGKAAANSTHKKLAVQWLNESLCFVASSLQIDSLTLRNRQLLIAAKRYAKPIGGSANINLSEF